MNVLRWVEHYSLVVMTVVFAAIIVTTYWPGRKAKIEQRGHIPFEDDV